VEPSSITDSKEVCCAGMAAPVFQEAGDDGALGVWPVSFSGVVFPQIHILMGDGCRQVDTTRSANFFVGATWLILPFRNLILPTFLTESRKEQGVKGNSKTRTPKW